MSNITRGYGIPKCNPYCTLDLQDLSRFLSKIQESYTDDWFTSSRMFMITSVTGNSVGYLEPQSTV